MDKGYADTVRLLLTVAPEVFANDIFAMRGLSPLSDEEIEELEAFLMEDRDGAEAMMFDTMDGYMHAVAIGPTTLKPQQWLPPIWGHTQQAQGMVLPAAQSLELIKASAIASGYKTQASSRAV